MRFLPTALVAIPLLTATVSAQIPKIGPAVTCWTGTSTATTTGLTACRADGAQGRPNFTAPVPSQLELREITINAYQGAATIGAGVLEFNFNPVTNAFAPTANAASLNVGAPFALTISEDGLVAAVDTNAGPIWARRASRGVPFGASNPITGITGTYVDSKLYTDGTQLKYAWVNGNDIWSGNFNASTGAVTGGQLIISASTTASSTGGGLHSHHPITREAPAGSGNYVVLGWIFSQNNGGGDSDTWYLPSANEQIALTNQGAYKVFDNTAWQNNGTSVGSSGTLLICDGSGGAPFYIPLVALNNATFPVAQNSAVLLRGLTEWSSSDLWSMNICFGIPFPQAIPVPFISIGNTLNPAGQTTPATGSIGISLNPCVTLPSSFGTANPGGVDLPLIIQAGTLPANTPIPMQVVGINFTKNQLFTGNTAVLEGK